MPADLHSLPARRLRRRARPRPRRRASRSATAAAASAVSPNPRSPAPADEAADRLLVVADSFFSSGRVASRPGYPAEPAARSRPFGRVSLTPPFAALTPRSAWPGGSLRLPPPAFPPPFAVANGALRPSRRGPVRSIAPAAPHRFRFRNRSPRRSVPWFGSFLRPSAARLSHPTQRAARGVTICLRLSPNLPSTYLRLRSGTTKSYSRRAGKSAPILGAHRTRWKSTLVTTP